MGWMEFLICEKLKIAFEIGRHHNLDNVNKEEYHQFQELIQYLNEEEDKKIDVVNHLLSKSGNLCPLQIFVLGLKDMYSEHKWEVVHEDEFKDRNNYKVITFGME